jgi:formamidopyrimidine-DNA glycosylase
MRVGRRAKYLLLETDGGIVLLAHLGMSGRLVLTANGRREPGSPHEHVLFEIEDGGELRFQDHRRFGLMTLVAKGELQSHPLLRELGPEPLSQEFTGALLGSLLEGKRTPLKAALIDQRVVAGLGNIYACECLHRAALSPRRLAATVRGERADRLARAIRAVLSEAIEAGGSSLRDYVQASGELGSFQERWAVYGREGQPCPRCARPIRRVVQANRSTFYCARCQR